MKYTDLLLLACLLLPGCIEIRQDDDASRDLTATNRKRIAPFDLADTGKEHPLSNADAMAFQETDADKIKRQVQLGKKTWIYLWGPWCSPCRQKLPYIAQFHRDHPEVNILLVSDSYDIPGMQKLLYDSRFFVSTYILDYQRYGNKIYEKARKLWDDMQLEGEYMSAMPQNYLFDAGGRLLFFGTGAIPDDQMHRFLTAE